MIDPQRITEIEERLEMLVASSFWTHVKNGETVCRDLRTLLDALATVTAERDELRSMLHDTTPCPVCQWPLPPDADHHICACCGCHVSYDEATHQFNGEWWSKAIGHEPPEIVKRLQARAEAMARAVKAWQEAKRKCDAAMADISAHKNWDEEMEASVRYTRADEEVEAAESALLALQTDPTE